MQPHVPLARQQASTPSGKQLCLQLHLPGVLPPLLPAVLLPLPAAVLVEPLTPARPPPPPPLTEPLLVLPGPTALPVPAVSFVDTLPALVIVIVEPAALCPVLSGQSKQLE